jgi:hypothetical protein
VPVFLPAGKEPIIPDIFLVMPGRVPFGFTVVTVQIRYLHGGDAELQGYLLVFSVFVAYLVSSYRVHDLHVPSFPRFHGVDSTRHSRSQFPEILICFDCSVHARVSKMFPSF